MGRKAGMKRSLDLNSYQSTELKLSALLLAEIPNASIEVYEQGNFTRKTIKVLFPKAYKKEVEKLVQAFIDKQAMANVYAYNKALNAIRDRLRGNEVNGRNYQRA